MNRMGKRWLLPSFAGVAAAMVVGGCDGPEHVSFSYQDHQPRHHHVWARVLCGDCGGYCERCKTCPAFEHKHVRVHVEVHPVEHVHHWVVKWCRQCGADCQFCPECHEFHHAHAVVRIEVPVKHEHHHNWALKWCKECGGQCRVCGSCKEIVHLRAGGKHKARPGR